MRHRWTSMLAGSAATDVLLWGTVVLGVALAMGVALLLLRRKVHGDSPGPDWSRGFTIEQLEQMLSVGDISDAEFRTLRDTALKLDAQAGGGHDAPSSDGMARDDEEQEAAG